MAARNPSGDLGIILGAVVGALLDQGHALPEIRQWVERAAQARKAANVMAAAMAGGSDEQ